MLERLRNLIVRHPAAAAFAAAAVLLSLGSAGTEIVRIDVRFAVMLGELRDRAPGIFPTINGFPYADYFSLWFFAAYLTTLGGRWINLWSLTLPAVLLGSAVFACVVAIGEHRRRGLGVLAAGLLAASWEFLLVLLSFGIDVPVTAAAALMLWRLECRPERRRTNPLLCFLLAAAALMIRGPLGAILFGSVTGGYLLASRRWREALSVGAAGLAGVLVSGGAVAAMIWRQGGEELWRLFLAWQIGSRIDSYDPLYYFTSGLLSFTPVTIAAVAAVLMLRRKLFLPENAGVFGAAVLPLLLLSIPGCKHLRYMAPALPAIALLGAEAVSRLLESGDGIASKFLALLHRFLPALLCGIFVAVGATGVLFRHGEFFAFGNLAAGILAALALRALAAPARGGTARFAAVGAGAMLAITAGLYPLYNSFESSRPTVRRIEALRRGGRIWIYRIGPDHNDLKYRLHADPDAPAATVWIGPKPKNPGKPDHLRRMYGCRNAGEAVFRAGEVVLTTPERAEEVAKLRNLAPLHPVKVLDGELGHRRVVLLRLEERSSSRAEK